MEEHNGFSVRSDSGLGTQTSDLFTFNVSYCSLDVVDFYTDVMDPTSFILSQISGNGRLLSQRMQQLQLRICQFNKDRGDSVLGKILGVKEKYL